MDDAKIERDILLDRIKMLENERRNRTESDEPVLEDDIVGPSQSPPPQPQHRSKRKKMDGKKSICFNQKKEFTKRKVVGEKTFCEAS